MPTFTDFDKMNAFPFTQNTTIRRKRDENTAETFTFSSPKVAARFLFESLWNMALLPTDPELREWWMQGYQTQIHRVANNPFAVETIDKLQSSYLG